MNFLVDAQLPVRLARLLTTAGHDAIHTTDLAGGNRTPDKQIAQLADAQRRVVVTKDRDFRNSHLLNGSPRRLLVLVTGNISNTDLLILVEAHLETIIAGFSEADFVEVGSDTLILHRKRDSRT